VEERLTAREFPSGNTRDWYFLFGGRYERTVEVVAWWCWLLARGCASSPNVQAWLWSWLVQVALLRGVVVASGSWEPAGNSRRLRE
jgi:hypothetical protein